MEKVEINEVISSELKAFWGEEPTSTDESTKVIKTNNLSYEGKISFDNITLRQIDKNKIGSNYLKKGDLLIEKSGGTKTHSVGYVNFFDGDDNTYVANNFILTLRPNKDKIIPKFLFYQMRYFYENGVFSNCYNKTTGIQNLKKDTYLSKKVIVPSKDIQAKIKDELENIETLINSKKESIIDLDKLIKSRFIEMFMNKGYSKTSIRNVVDTKKISAKKTYKKDDEIKYIDISSIDNSKNQVVGYTPYVFENAPSRAQQCLITNDILVSTVRPNLKNIAIFTNESKGYVGSSGFCVLRASKCNPQYLKYIVLDDEFTEAMVKLTTGASYPAIRDDDVLNYEMIDAPIELQNEFASFVNLIDKSKFT